jgi:hypothetical protein
MNSFFVTVEAKFEIILKCPITYVCIPNIYHSRNRIFPDTRDVLHKLASFQRHLTAFMYFTETSLLTTVTKAPLPTYSVLSETSSKQLSFITCVFHGPTKTCWFVVLVCTQKRLHSALQSSPIVEGQTRKAQVLVPCVGEKVQISLTSYKKCYSS